MSTRNYKNGIAKVGEYWWICFRRAGQKIERSTGCTNRSDAELVLAEERRKAGFARLGVKLPESINAPALEVVVHEWAESNRGVLADRYLAQGLEGLERHWGPIAALPLQDISSSHVEALRKAYLGSNGYRIHKGTRTIVAHTLGGWNRQIRLLSAIFGWAIRVKNYLPSRPWNAQERKVQQIARPVVWPEQVQEYLLAIDERTYRRDIALGIRMQLGLGLRETETGTSRWEWLSWRQNEYVPGATKNRRTRKVPIPAWLMALLKVEWERQGSPKRGLILPDAKGDLQNRGYSKNAVRLAGEDIGVHGLHPHRLRATFATTHYEAGTPLSEIQQMLGHKKPETTLRYIEMRQVGAAAAQDRVAMMMGFSFAPDSLIQNKVS